MTAQPSRTTPSDRLAQLESDLRYQLELGSRLDRAAFDSRSKQLEDALEAWRQSPQSRGDYELITGWMRQAILRSLPGESGEWPATPEFGAKRHEARKEVSTEENVENPEARGHKPASAHEEPRVVATVQPDASNAAKAESEKQPQHVTPLIVSKTAPEPIRIGKPTTAEPRRDEPGDVGVAKKSVGPPPAPQRSVIVHDASPVEASPGNVADRPAPTQAQTASAYRGAKVEPAVAKPRAADVPVQVNLSELRRGFAGTTMSYGRSKQRSWPVARR